MFSNPYKSYGFWSVTELKNSNQMEACEGQKDDLKSDIQTWKSMKSFFF